MGCRYRRRPPPPPATVSRQPTEDSFLCDAEVPRPGRHIITLRPPLVGVTDRTLISPGFLRHQSPVLGSAGATDTLLTRPGLWWPSLTVSDRPPPLGELFVPRRAAKQDVFAPQSPVKAATGHAARKQADCAAATRPRRRSSRDSSGGGGGGGDGDDGDTFLSAGPRRGAERMGCDCSLANIINVSKSGRRCINRSIRRAVRDAAQRVLVPGASTRHAPPLRPVCGRPRRRPPPSTTLHRRGAAFDAAPTHYEYRVFTKN